MEALSKSVVHEICTNQVVVTLHACVKELLENSLDAGATRIEVRLRENGTELLEVVDDGRGITPEDYAKLATRHATSKIRQYDDLSMTERVLPVNREQMPRGPRPPDSFHRGRRRRPRLA